MNVINDLKREHRDLRSAVRALGSALRTGDDAWDVLRKASSSLAIQLQAHCHREEQLLTVHRSVLSTEYLALAVGAHADELDSLARVNHFFAGTLPRPLEIIRPRFTRLLEALHEQMERQEVQLFPAIEDALVLYETDEQTQTAGRSVFAQV